jgi:hypothetical protein
MESKRSGGHRPSLRLSGRASGGANLCERRCRPSIQFPIPKNSLRCLGVSLTKERPRCHIAVQLTVKLCKTRQSLRALKRDEPVSLRTERPRHRLMSQRESHRTKVQHKRLMGRTSREKHDKHIRRYASAGSENENTFNGMKACTGGGPA